MLNIKSCVWNFFSLFLTVEKQFHICPLTEFFAFFTPLSLLKTHSRVYKRSRVMIDLLTANFLSASSLLRKTTTYFHLFAAENCNSLLSFRLMMFVRNYETPLQIKNFNDGSFKSLNECLKLAIVVFKWTFLYLLLFLTL